MDCIEEDVGKTWFCLVGDGGAGRSWSWLELELVGAGAGWSQ